MSIFVYNCIAMWIFDIVLIVNSARMPLYLKFLIFSDKIVTKFISISWQGEVGAVDLEYNLIFEEF